MEYALQVTVLLYTGGLFCFAGYRLRQAMVSLAGILGGVILGLVLARLLKPDALWLRIGLAAALGIALGLTAFKLHKLALFLLCGACALLLCRQLLILYTAAWLETWMIWAVSVAVGILVGLLVYRFYRPVVIITLALFGGMLMADTVFSLLPQNVAVQRLGQLVGLGSAAAGAIVQFLGPRR